MKTTYLPGDIQERIKELLHNSNISQEELAIYIGISPSKLSRFLRRETSVIEPCYLVMIATFFRVSTDFLLGTTNDKVPVDYEVQNLGLSAVAIRRLINGEVDAGVISQLIEHGSAGEITHSIRSLQDDPVSQSLDMAARLTSQIITYAEADGTISAAPENEYIRQEAKTCVSDAEDQFLTQQRINKLSSALMDDLIKEDVYLHDLDDVITRHYLEEAYDEAKEKSRVGFQKHEGFQRFSSYGCFCVRR